MAVWARQRKAAQSSSMACSLPQAVVLPRCAGVVLFALLSGVLPFQEKNESRLQQAVMAGRYSFGNPAWSEVSSFGFQG
jgi:hypothetical protein